MTGHWTDTMFRDTKISDEPDPCAVDIVAKLMGLTEQDFKRLARRDRTHFVWRDSATGAIRVKKRDLRDFRLGRYVESSHRSPPDRSSAAGSAT